MLDIVPLNSIKNTESELWQTIRDFGESLVDDCSKSRLIYHFNTSYFEPVEFQLKMRKDWINYSNSIMIHWPPLRTVESW